MIVKTLSFSFIFLHKSLPKSRYFKIFFGSVEFKPLFLPTFVLMTTRIGILWVIVLITLSSVVYFSFFTQLQDKRINQLRTTVDSMENERQRYLEQIIDSGEKQSDSLLNLEATR